MRNEQLFKYTIFKALLYVKFYGWIIIKDYPLTIMFDFEVHHAISDSDLPS